MKLTQEKSIKRELKSLIEKKLRLDKHVEGESGTRRRR